MGVLFAGLMLVGCATTNQVMQEDQYASFARSLYGINHCSESGRLPPDVTAKGINILKNKINTYQYYPERLKAFVELKASEGNVPSDSDCNQLAVIIHGQSQANATYNQPIQNYQINQPINTVCNRIGTQTMCTTY